MADAGENSATSDFGCQTDTGDTVENASGDADNSPVKFEDHDSDISDVSHGLSLTYREVGSKTSDDDRSSGYAITSLSCASSGGSTRRTSLVSDSDLEIPFHLLFRESLSGRDSPANSPVQLEENILNGIDRMLSRLASERFLELRRIQLGNRPVTSGTARDNIQNFLQQAISGSHAVHEANRPQHVVDDVQSLLQQSLVRSALQAESFRSHLEQAIGRRVQQHSVLSNVTNALPQQPSRVAPRSLSLPRNFQERLESILAARLGSRQSPSSMSANVNRSPATVQATSTPQILRENVSEQILRENVSAQPQPASVTNATQGRHNVAMQRLEISVENGMHLLAQTITEDLDRLQNLQLVSSVLRTEFREELERMMEEHVHAVGNGEAVQAAVQQLPRRTHQAAEPASAMRRSHYSQAVLDNQLAGEVNALRRQVEEMKRIMYTSIEVQLDTQRAVRQEVAAVFAAFMQDYLLPRRQNQGHGPVSASSMLSSVGAEPARPAVVSSGQCVICVERDINTVLYQCGHMCTCFHCGMQLKLDGQHCPMCRAPTRDVIRAYQTQAM